MISSGVNTKALDRDFLEIRCRLIDLAAALDRIDRSDDPQKGDPRRSQIVRALQIIASDVSNRAEQVQLEFSIRA